MLARASVASVNQMIRGGKLTCMVSERASRRGIFGVSALLFAAAVTIAWCPSFGVATLAHSLRFGAAVWAGSWFLAVTFVRRP
jgi:hypothetical protein